MATRICEGDERALVGFGRREGGRLGHATLLVLLELPVGTFWVLLVGFLDLHAVERGDGVEHDGDDVTVGAPEIGPVARLRRTATISSVGEPSVSSRRCSICFLSFSASGSTVCTQRT